MLIRCSGSGTVAKVIHVYYGGVCSDWTFCLMWKSKPLRSFFGASLQLSLSLSPFSPPLSLSLSLSPSLPLSLPLSLSLPLNRWLWKRTRRHTSRPVSQSVSSACSPATEGSQHSNEPLAVMGFLMKVTARYSKCPSVGHRRRKIQIVKSERHFESWKESTSRPTIECLSFYHCTLKYWSKQQQQQQSLQWHSGCLALMHLY